MIRGLLKLIVLVVVIVAAGVFFLGWNLGDRTVEVDDTGQAVGTAGRTAADETRQAADRTAEKGREAYEEAVKQLVRFVTWFQNRPKDQRRDLHRRAPTMPTPWGQQPR